MHSFTFVEGAVRRNRLLTNLTNAAVENEMKLWLRQSCDRGCGRWERERAKKRQRSRTQEHSDESHRQAAKGDRKKKLTSLTGASGTVRLTTVTVRKLLNRPNPFPVLIAKKDVRKGA